METILVVSGTRSRKYKIDFQPSFKDMDRIDKIKLLDLIKEELDRERQIIAQELEDILLPPTQGYIAYHTVRDCRNDEDDTDDCLFADDNPRNYIREE